MCAGGTFAPCTGCFPEHLISCLAFEEHLALMMSLALVPVLHFSLNRSRHKMGINGHKHSYLLKRQMLEHSSLSRCHLRVYGLHAL